MANDPSPATMVVDEERRRADDVRGVIGYSLAVAITITCLCFAIFVIPDRPLNVLILFLGGALGWLTGILCSPDDPRQEKRFKGFAVVVASLVSGYIAGKADAFWNSISASPMIQEHDVLERVLLFLVIFVTGIIVTFIGRTYSDFWLGSTGKGV